MTQDKQESVEQIVDENFSFFTLKSKRKIAKALQSERSKADALREENERLRNRVNLLSVSANQIRDAYDNGLNAELKAELSTTKAQLEVCRVALESAAEYMSDACGCHDPGGCDVCPEGFPLDKARKALSTTQPLNSLRRLVEALEGYSSPHWTRIGGNDYVYSSLFEPGEKPWDSAEKALAEVKKEFGL